MSPFGSFATQLALVPVVHALPTFASAPLHTVPWYVVGFAAYDHTCAGGITPTLHAVCHSATVHSRIGAPFPSCTAAHAAAAAVSVTGAHGSTPGFEHARAFDPPTACADASTRDASY